MKRPYLQPSFQARFRLFYYEVTKIDKQGNMLTILDKKDS